MYVDEDAYPPEKRLVPEYVTPASIDITRLGRYRVSSQKGEFGLQNILDNARGTFWQSDGLLPHFVDIEFAKTVKVSQIALFTDRNIDESYTPLYIEVSAGYGRFALTKVDAFELDGREGWQYLNWESRSNSSCRTQCGDVPYLACTYLRVAVKRNFENGKDTRLKGLRVLAPRAAQRARFDRV